MSDEPRAAHSVVEAYFHLQVTPCAACGHGALTVSGPFGTEHPRCVRFETVCRNCGTATPFRFETPAPLSPAELRAHPQSSQAPISTVREPSRLVDPIQWVTLAHLAIESIEVTPSAAEQRWARIRAAQCLDEALKFYEDDNELPPSAALRTESSRTALHDHPQRYARSRLAALRASLPADGVVDRLRAQEGQPARRRPWWRFWQG